MSRFMCMLAFGLVCGALVLAQGEPAGGPVKVTRILDMPQTRVAQVEIQPNATRPLHSHPEALWHVFVTTDAPMDLLIEGQPDVHLEPWHAHFFTGGTMHGFRNPNSRTVRWIELFALKSAGAVAMDETAARELAMMFGLGLKAQGSSQNFRP
jgi:quercetin dioxygenase-like cupin family protein